MAKLSQVLRERGYVYQHSSETLEEITDGAKRTFYWGVDPTADSLHIGQLQGLMILRRFIEDSHKLIVIVGGGTGMIGDPSGKSDERNLLDTETVERNTEAIRTQLERLFGRDDFKMINNAEWLHRLNLMTFLRDIGKHFTVNEMIKRDAVRPRLETPDASISYTEFSYMLLQAYDYLHLHQVHGCDLQVGGSDQWGNILSGVELIRRTTGDAAYALSWPLLVNPVTGKKFGKSEGGAVWLDPHKTTPFQFYQFWFNSEDGALREYMIKMTMMSLQEIETTLTAHEKNPTDRTGQRKLAHEVTRMAHGQEAADSAEMVSEALFGDIPLSDLDDATRDILRSSAPLCRVSVGESLVDILISAGLASSKREARQFLTDSAVTVSGKVVGEASTLQPEDMSGDMALLRRGRRNVVVLSLA